MVNDKAAMFACAGLRVEDCGVLYEHAHLTVLGPPPGQVFGMKLLAGRAPDHDDMVAHLPPGTFNASGARLAPAAIAFNLTSAAGTLASRFQARATTATICRQLINIPARPVRAHLPAPRSPPSKINRSQPQFGSVHPG